MRERIKIDFNQPPLFIIREDGTLELPFSKKGEQSNIDPNRASLRGTIKLRPPVISGKDRAAGEREDEDD